EPEVVRPFIEPRDRLDYVFDGVDGGQFPVRDRDPRPVFGGDPVFEVVGGGRAVRIDRRDQFGGARRDVDAREGRDRRRLRCREALVAVGGFAGFVDRDDAVVVRGPWLEVFELRADRFAARRGRAG